MAAGMLCASVCVVAAVAAETAESDVVVSTDELKFSAGTPKGTTRISGLSLWGKAPADGPISALVKFTKGATPKHFHNMGERVVVVKGTVIHWTEALPETRTKHLEPGSYWYVPTKAVHQDICLTEECILLVSLPSSGITTTDLPETK